MTDKTLYMLFAQCLKNPNATNGYANERKKLREMVKASTGIYNTMPDRVLLSIMRRKVFAERLNVPNDRIEKEDVQEIIEIFGEDYEDLFKL